MHIPAATVQICPTCGARPRLFVRLLNTLRQLRNTHAEQALSEDQFSEARALDEDLQHRRGQVHDRHFF
ncbi:hypothetical protein JCM19000A_39140 [Silvimonas sp. JCM 19000]